MVVYINVPRAYRNIRCFDLHCTWTTKEKQTYLDGIKYHQCSQSSLLYTIFNPSNQQCKSHTQRALQASIRLALYIKKDTAKIHTEFSFLVRNFPKKSQQSLEKEVRSLRTEIRGLPCNQQSNNQTEETQNRAENLNDEDLDEPV